MYNGKTPRLAPTNDTPWSALTGELWRLVREFYISDFFTLKICICRTFVDTHDFSVSILHVNVGKNSDLIKKSQQSLSQSKS